MKKLTLSVALLLAGSFAAMAQILPPDPPIPSPDPIPVDGGASVLAAMGVAYGVKRLKERRAELKK